MKLTWVRGTGPGTTQELADLVETEGRLLKGSFWCPEGRCLWGIILDYTTYVSAERHLERFDSKALHALGLSSRDNDKFLGTPEEHCAEMVRRLRSIP